MFIPIDMVIRSAVQLYVITSLVREIVRLFSPDVICKVFGLRIRLVRNHRRGLFAAWSITRLQTW